MSYLIESSVIFSKDKAAVVSVLLDTYIYVNKV